MAATTDGGTRVGEPRASGRERIIRAAYELFSRHGTRAVGVDAVIAKANVAKKTLYRNFASKDELILSFLELREELWTREWLQGEVQRRESTAAGRLLAVFDVFGEWFARDDFEGCAFLTVMLEIAQTEHPIRRASVRYLANIREFLIEQAKAAGVSDPDALARQWHILMQGSIMAATEGDVLAAARAKELGMLLLRSYGVRIETVTAPPAGTLLRS